MITKRIGFHSVLLPSFIAWVGKQVLLQYLDIEARKLHIFLITFSSLSSCFRTTLKRQIWIDYGNYNSWLPFMRNADDVVVCAHATESIATQRTRLMESLIKSVTFLFWVNQQNIWIDKLLFHAVRNNDRVITFKFPWSHFGHFLQPMTTFWGTVYTVK